MGMFAGSGFEHRDVDHASGDDAEGQGKHGAGDDQPRPPHFDGTFAGAVEVKRSRLGGVFAGIEGGPATEQTHHGRALELAISGSTRAGDLITMTLAVARGTGSPDGGLAGLDNGVADGIAGGCGLTWALIAGLAAGVATASFGDATGGAIPAVRYRAPV